MNENDKETIAVFARANQRTMDRKVFEAAKEQALKAYGRNCTLLSDKEKEASAHMGFMRETLNEVPDLALRHQYRQKIITGGN